MPRAAASCEMRAGEGRVRVREPVDVVAGQAHVQLPVAEVDIRMVVGRLSRVGHLADEGGPVEKNDGATNHASMPCSRMRQSGKS